MATYLDVVNDVLIRLREPVVTTVNQSAYSRLIGKLVNDAKREIEDAHDWNALASTVSINTVDNTYNYTLSGSRTRFRTIDVLNDSSNWRLEYKPTTWMNQQFLLLTAQKGAPWYYNYNGVTTGGDTQVDLFPIPDGAYTIRFNLIIPQADLSSDSTSVLVPDHLVAQYAYAKAIAERGEDAGVSSAEAFSIYRNSLADAIAIERNHYDEDMVWVTP
jgi:hypothetical protein